MRTPGVASVLLVDDRPEKLLAIEALLADMPIELVRATSGREALRHLLQRDFALILLDVNMPGMDGLETAALIRSRKNSEHIPIIFITAYGDEVFMERGYSLGAVDYILQPVVPEILRAKVGVFVELYQKKEEIKLQAEANLHRASQLLQRLAQISMQINSASSVDRISRLITDSLRDLIGGGPASACVIFDEEDFPQFQLHSSDSVACVERDQNLSPDQRKAIRLLLKDQKTVRINPLKPRLEFMAFVQLFSNGLLAARLTSGEGRDMGFVAVTDRMANEFSENDENLLLLLTQMASIAIENTRSAGARNANKAKDQFLAVLSHELQGTPLTPVLATLSQIDSDVRVPDDVLDDFKMIRRNVELEAKLIDDLLDLTRISKGKIELQLNSVDAHALIQDAVDICKSDIAGKALILRTNLAAKNSFVRGDFTRLHQVLWNLLKNAVKFTPSGGSIDVISEDSADGTLTIRIIDTGIGIEPDVLPRIFNAFEQGKRSITRQFGGLGLGLAITKALVDAHDGTISASSAGGQRGATFTLTLPLEHSHGVKQPPDLSTFPPVAFRPLKILLVEDHPDTGRVMSPASSFRYQEMHQVTLTRTVHEALTKYEAEVFDLVISDIGLPDGSGLDLMRIIQSRRPVSAIALSGFGMDEDIRRSREAGFHEHLTKPVNFSKLVHCIERIVVAGKLTEAATDSTVVQASGAGSQVAG